MRQLGLLKLIGSFILTYVLVWMGWSCSDSKSAAHPYLLGDWYAEWSTADPGFASIFPDQLNMKGTLHFDKKGKVQITAFGFPGCIFSHDTIANNLSWKVVGDSMTLANDDDRFKIFYNIRKIEEGKIDLVLMDDIWLTLSRK
jgi:hypothetical protein